MESIAETILQICAAKSMALNPEEYPESRPAEIFYGIADATAARNAMSQRTISKTAIRNPAAASRQSLSRT